MYLQSIQRVLFFLIVSFYLQPGRAMAQVNTWDNSANGVHQWETGANWSLDVPPASTHSAFITNSVAGIPRSRFVLINATTANTAPGSMTVSDLTVLIPTNIISSNFLLLENAGTNIPLHVLNALTIGRLSSMSITNSILRVSGGVQVQGGSLTLNTGKLITATTNPFPVNTSINATVNVLDGTWEAGPVHLGSTFTPSSGTLNISGGNITSEYMQVGSGNIASANLLSTGTVVMTGGQLTVPQNWLSIGHGAVGRFTVSNGTVRARQLWVGRTPLSQGSFTLAGGICIAENSAEVGNLPDASGMLTVSSGLMTVTNSPSAVLLVRIGTLTVDGGELVATRLVATNGNATIEFPAGTMTLRGTEIANGKTFAIGGAGRTAVLNLTAGTHRFDLGSFGLLVGDSGTGTVWVSDSQLTVTNSITEVGGEGVGQMTVSNSTWVARNVSVGDNTGGQGTLTMVGGTNLFQSVFILGFDPGGTGTVWLTRSLLVVTNDTTRVGYGGIGQMTVSNATWRASTVIVGDSAGSLGTLTIASGSSLEASVLNLGLHFGSTGAVSVAGGQLIATNGTTYIGSNGVGQVTVSNGLVRAGPLFVGYEPGSQGALALAGGDVEISGFLSLGWLSNSAGSVAIHSGQLLTTNIFTGIGGNQGSGTVIVSNGIWRAQSLFVGNGLNSRGTLTVAGGACTLSGVLSLADDNPLSTGTVWVTGGQLLVTNDATYVGAFGVGNMTISNGAWQASDVVLGDQPAAKGLLNIAGGTSTISSVLILGARPGTTGTVSMTGGELHIPNNYTAVGQGGVGQMTVSGGLWQAHDVFVGVGASAGAQGTLTIAGGTNRVSTSMILGNETCTTTGNVVVAAGALAVTNGGTATLEVLSGTFMLSGGTVRVDRFVLTNACAQFVRTGGTFIYGSAVLNPDDDTDGDGFSNANEQAAGSDPLDATSTPINVAFPPGDVNGTNGVTGADSLLINQVLVGLRSSNDAIFARAGFDNGDVNQTNGVNGADSLLINQVLVGLRSYVTTAILPSSHFSNQTTAVVIFGIGFPTNVVPTVTIGAPVNLTLTNVVVLSRERITAILPLGGGLGTGTVNVISSPTNGVISFGRFINE